MKLHITKTFSLLVAILLGPAYGSHAAEDTLIAFGRISAGGTVTRSVTTVGGTVSGWGFPNGRCVVEVEKQDAFIGATADDFIVHTTITTPLYQKMNCVASINLVTDHKVSIDVRTSDVEDSTNLSGHLLMDTSFYFTLHRVPSGTTQIPGESPYLFATGRIAPWGNLTSNVSIPGYETTSDWLNFGRTTITFEKEGAFADDDASDYVVIATPWSSSSEDTIVIVDTSDFASDDSVTIRFRTYDAQDQSDNDNIDPKNWAVHYSIYRVPGGGQPTPFQSNLNLALGKIDGDTGNIIRAATPFPGANITSNRLGEGSYQVTIESPGAFADLPSYDGVVQLGIDHIANIDEVASGRFITLDDDTIRIDVQIDDVEEAGTDDGTPTDRDFTFLIQTAVPGLHSDMKIGRKRSTAKMKGNNRYNTNAAGQKIRTRCKGSRAKYFFAVQNDGRVNDTLTLRKSGKARGLKPKFIRLTGGRANVTAQVKSAGFTMPDMNANQSVRFKAKLKMRGEKQRRSKLRLMTTSARGGTADTCLAKIKKEK